MSSSPGKRRFNPTPWMFLAPTLIVMGTFQFYPMLHAFALSTWDFFPGSPNNEFVGLRNFKLLIQDRAFHAALINSLLYLLCVPVIVTASVGLALMVEPKLPGMNFFRACYYLPVVTMMVVVAFAWKLILNTDNGLLNLALMEVLPLDRGIPWLSSERLALWSVMAVTVWKGLGYYMVMFIVGLKAVPQELLEAARIDGAGRRQTFLNVTLPCLWPTITIVSIISSIAALQVFEEIYMMTSGRVGTATIVYEIYNTGFDMTRGMIDLGYACAMGIVLFALIFAFTSFTIRRMEGAFTT